jgi:hypothetical protein
MMKSVRIPSPQKCPAFKASNIVENDQGVMANLTLAGPNCQALWALLISLECYTKEISDQAFSGNDINGLHLRATARLLSRIVTLD